MSVTQDEKLDLTMSPVYILRTFIWQMLVANELMNPGDYEVPIPIVPLSEEPELQTTSKPYIVYGYSGDATGNMWMETTGQMSLAIYDQNFRRLTKIMNALQATFERRDEIATELNKFSSLLVIDSDGAGSAPATKPFIGIRFGDVRVGFVEGGTPENEEGGRQSALFSIRFSYFVNYNIKTWQNGEFV